ncbi:MAG: hypothetical protein LAT68_06255 [Cyclobacteriaceae bacterium]|nr:hypothetical protein [Cyclobacteriaceae bacterium]MCH8515913.1 hypothetical protein [Cyclobacteriaceae bacterium]
MRVSFFFLLALCLFACDSRNFEVSEKLSKEEAKFYKSAIIRYVAPMPKKATTEDKFVATYNEWYENQMDKHRLELYYFDELSNRHYFSITRNAPSLYKKRVATSGYFTLNEKDEIIDYEEVYRTWRLVPEELQKKNKILFGKLIKGEDLSPFYTKNNEEEYIEFPDDFVAYDKENRKWEMRAIMNKEVERNAATILRP